MDEVKWIIGLLVGFVTMLGGVIARDRQVLNKIEEGDERVMRRMEILNSDLKSVSDRSVRRDDMQQSFQIFREDTGKHFTSIEKMMTITREEQRELMREVYAMLKEIKRKD